MRHLAIHFPPVYAGTAVTTQPDAHMTKADASDEIGTSRIEDLAGDTASSLVGL